jgi:hypothetical protein
MKLAYFGLALALLALPAAAHHSFAAEFDARKAVRLVGKLTIGDTLVIDGYRAKDGSHLIDARRVTLPDGRTIYGGSPGDGGPGDTAGSNR